MKKISLYSTRKKIFGVFVFHSEYSLYPDASTKRPSLHRLILPPSILDVIYLWPVLVLVKKVFFLFSVSLVMKQLCYVLLAW